MTYYVNKHTEDDGFWHIHKLEICCGDNALKCDGTREDAKKVLLENGVRAQLSEIKNCGKCNTLW